MKVDFDFDDAVFVEFGRTIAVDLVHFIETLPGKDFGDVAFDGDVRSDGPPPQGVDEASHVEAFVRTSAGPVGEVTRPASTKPWRGFVSR